jgi:exoribonuclease II
MTQQGSQEIPAGTVLEFFEAKEIICGVCLASKNQRLNVLTQQNREINLASSRILHFGSQLLKVQSTRDEMVQSLNSIAALRIRLMAAVNVEELWSLVEGEEEGFSARDLAEFVFAEAITDHHVAATQRVLLQERLFFQFKDARFHANSQEKIDQRSLEIEREKEKELQLDEGSQWLRAVWNRKPRPALAGLEAKLVENLKSFCLYGQESPACLFVKELLKRADIPQQPQSAFRLMVRLGIWHENENLYLHEQGITPDFPEEVIARADRLAASSILSYWDQSRRRDLRELDTITIDSALSRDIDDALSLRTLDNGLYEVGVHIADVAEFVGSGDELDTEAEARVSSIYLPDGRITMFPPSLSEGLFSLHTGEDRLSLSFIMHLDDEAVIHHQEIVPSVLRVHRQMTYHEVNERWQEDETLRILHALAEKLRAQRLARGAVILPLPEINVYVNAAGMIQVSRYEKETPGQIMVSEWMIAANGLAASYLARQEVPAIFRGQAECRQETDFTQSEHELFRIYRQRRLFARAEIEPRPQPHCSLAMAEYTTITSPIRRYADLVVQRQLKHVLTTGTALYGEDELRQVITRLGVTQAKILLVQRKWTRYWILKYLEQEDMQTLNALVLTTNGRFAHLLIPDYFIEANAPLTERNQVRPGEMVKVKIDRLNPREDLIRVQLPEFPKPQQ